MLPYLGAAAALWTLANLKSSRPDGELIKGVHPYRQLMQYVMPGRNESVVYYDEYYNAENMLQYLEDIGERFNATMTHVIVAAAARALQMNPEMNRFTAGRRLYQRNQVELTFSVKRKKLNKKSKLAAVKMPMPEGETFRELCERVDGKINHQRSGKKTYEDKEYNLFNLLPRPVLEGASKAMTWLDYHNLLPGEFIKNDGMYTSMFIANLGSVNMTPGYHHLYEWGNCPLFMMVGRIEEMPVVENGEVVVRKMLHVRYSFDERVNDGLTARYALDEVRFVIEDPAYYLGCLTDDGADTYRPNERTRPVSE